MFTLIRSARIHVGYFSSELLLIVEAFTLLPDVKNNTLAWQLVLSVSMLTRVNVCVRGAAMAASPTSL